MSHGSGAGPFAGESITPPTTASQQNDIDLCQVLRSACRAVCQKAVPVCTKQTRKPKH